MARVQYAIETRNAYFITKTLSHLEMMDERIVSGPFVRIDTFFIFFRLKYYYSSSVLIKITSYLVDMITSSFSTVQ